MVADYDFWLLDLDGTLVDVETAYVHDVVGEVGDRLGADFTREEAERLWYGFAADRDAVLDAHGLDGEPFWTTFHEVEDAEARAAATYLFDDADFVGDLDVPVGLVTHCQRYLTEPVLAALDIDDWFDAVVCCTEDLGWKPSPEPVYHTMRAMGVAATGGDGGVAADGSGRRGVLAGDNPSDVGAAWNAGLDGVHVERHGAERRGFCVLGDYRVASFDELR